MADKIAIFGGSFNPIHNGHIEVAKSAMEECNLKKVVFLPNATPPHKDNSILISAEHRYNMVAQTVRKYNGFDVSDYEMKKQGPSYTIDTMRRLKLMYNADLYFIIGADSLYTLHTWKSYNELIKECRFIVADRTCSQGNDIKKAADKIKSAGGNVEVLKMKRFDVTSTQIRAMLQMGKDVSGILPTQVIKYIKDNNLYKNNPEDKNDY